MSVSICFTRPTVKLLIQLLKKAYDAGALRLVRRISVLLSLAKQEPVAQVAETFSVSRQTVYDWLKAFILYGADSLVYRRPPGRKPKLTKTQKKRLAELIEMGGELTRDTDGDGTGERRFDPAPDRVHSVGDQRAYALHLRRLALDEHDGDAAGGLCLPYPESNVAPTRGQPRQVDHHGGGRLLA